MCQNDGAAAAQGNKAVRGCSGAGVAITGYLLNILKAVHHFDKLETVLVIYCNVTRNKVNGHM